MRPEAHCIHHQRGVHAYNYGNIPLWDVVFGTLPQPRDLRRFGGIRHAIVARERCSSVEDVSGGLGDGLHRRNIAPGRKDRVMA